MIDTNALRKKVLDLAIRGKLVPQNPNDEPASVLLERIREEKQRLIREGKIKKDKVDSVIFRGDDNCYYEKIGNSEPILVEDLPFEIPNSWSWVRFSSLIKVISGVSYDKHDVCNKGIRILRGGNINNFNVSIEDDDVFLPDGYYDEEKQVRINDILIVASTGSKLAIGKAGYVTTNLENTQIGAFLRIVRPLFEEFAEYIKIIFATSYYKEHILDSIRGSNINNLKNEHISNLLIPIPPIEEQSRIAKYIKEIFAQIDLIEQNQSDYNSLVETLKKAILQYAIQGKLVEQDEKDEPANELLAKIRAEKKEQLGKKYVESYIYKGVDNRYYEHIGGKTRDITQEIPFKLPNKWCWVRLGMIGDWGAGATPSRNIPDYYGGNIPWLKTGELNNGVVYDSEEKITELALKNCSLRYNKIGDILIAMYGATIGKLAIAGVNLTTNQACCACTPFNGIYNLYLFEFLKASKEKLIELGKGGAQPNISKEKIVNYLFPLPPFNEQKRIVSNINEIFAQL